METDFEKSKLGQSFEVKKLMPAATSVPSLHPMAGLCNLQWFQHQYL